jgi:hypothetical protein
MSTKNKQTGYSQPERAGMWFGRACRRLMHRERSLARWLLERGVSVRVASVAIWIAKLAILAGVLYVSAVLAFLVAIALIAAAVTSQSRASNDGDSPQWRNGSLGFGLYDRDGHRIDPHDPDDQQGT